MTDPASVEVLILALLVAFLGNMVGYHYGVIAGKRARRRAVRIKRNVS